MKHTDFDRAFGVTPECVRAAIEAGFRAGARAAARKGESAPAAGPRESEASRRAELRTGVSGVDARWDEFIPDRRESARGAGLPSPALRAARAAARRRKIAGAMGVAAVLALTLSVAVLSTARPGAPRPDTFRPVARPGRGANGPYTGPTHPIASAPADSGGDGQRAATAKRPAPEAEVYVTDGGRYYHTVPDCSGMQGARALSAEEAEAAGQQPCPVCIGADAKSGPSGKNASEATPSPDSQAESYEVPATHEVNGELPTFSSMKATVIPPMESAVDEIAPSPTARETNAELPAVSSTEAAIDAHAERFGLIGTETVISVFPSPVEVQTSAVENDDAADFAFLSLENRVYATGGGRYFHAVPGCSGMDNARPLSVADALALGKEVCPHCPDPDAFVYATDSGRYLHLSPNCTGMENARAMSIGEALELGKKTCPTCFAPDAFLYATDGGRYFHVLSNCSGMENARSMTLVEALELGKEVCPRCIDGEATVYAVGDGCHYHASPVCSGMENAQRMSLNEALKAGRAPCPLCTDAEDASAMDAETDAPAAQADMLPVEIDASSAKTDVSSAVADAPAAQIAISTAEADAPSKQIASFPAMAVAPAAQADIPPVEIDASSAKTDVSSAVADAPAAQIAISTAEADAPSKQIASFPAMAVASAAQAASRETGSISVLPEAEICKDFPKGGAAEVSDTALYADSGFGAPLNGAFELDAMVCTSSETSLYHADPGCVGREAAQVMTVLSALTLGKSPCPACVGASTCVYATGDGPCYHALPDCSGMQNARATALEIALNAGKAPCPVCVGTDALVYATGGGVYCHTEADCSGMRNAEAMLASRAGLLGKNPCPLCMAEKTELARTVLFNNALYLSTSRNAAVSDADSLRFYYTANGSWFHLTPNCSGMQNAGAHVPRELYGCGKKPCPLCFADEAAGELYRIPAPEDDGDAVLVSGFSSVSGCFHRDPFCFGMQMCYETTLAHARDFQNLGPCPACLPGLAGEADSMPCVVDADGVYYHLRDDCPRLGEGAQETTRLLAQASGRMHCPDCAALSPDGADRFEALFGFSLSEIEEGYSYERTDLRADGAREWFLSDGIVVDSLGFYAPDGAGGGTLSIGYFYDGSIQLWTLPAEFFDRTAEPLHSLYWARASAELKACLADPQELDRTLTACRGVSLRFDADCNVTACMLSFISPGGSCDLGWEADGSGGFQLAYRRCYGEGWTQTALQEKIGS